MRWATRRGCHVDRTACVWLIRRFVDPKAGFFFVVDPAEAPGDADLMDEKYGRPESEGLDSIIRGMQLALSDDQSLTYHTDALYDGLYAYLRREVL